MNKREGFTFKIETKEPPKKVNHKRNIKFMNLLVTKNISNKEREGPLKRTPSLK
jgi:hypothetical protein